LLDPQNSTDDISHCDFRQTVEKLIFKVLATAAILDFCPLKFFPTLLRGAPLLVHLITFIEDRKTEKQTSELHGHGSAPDDPTKCGLYSI